MSRILVVGAGPGRSHLINEVLKGTGGRVTRKGWATFLDLRRKAAPDLVIYDLGGANAPRTDILLSLPETMPHASVLYLASVDTANLEGLSPAFQRPHVDFVINTADPRELGMRVTRLLAGREGRTAAPERAEQTDRHQGTAFLHAVPHLHAENGRLDARIVSTLYGVSLAALSRALGRSEQSVHKTPAGASIQAGLSVYERIAAILLRLTGSEAGLRTWIRASNPELDNEIPIDLLLTGDGEVVLDLLEAVQSGEPA